MLKKIMSLIGGILLSVLFVFTAFAADVPRAETPNYRVAFYASPNYHIQDENGRRYGYGYEMMQAVSCHIQCTFSYIGYDKMPDECVEMLRNGELDIYTAAGLTPERQAEFAISTHPAVTARTCMNVKVGNTRVRAGDYSTYNGMRVGLLRRHTYNDKFLKFAEEKGFDCEIKYYDTPTELTNALIEDEVDALVNSYIHTPEDERTIEDFGSTPYYIMARKEDQALIDDIDQAIDAMNVETPNWREDLYNKYYGSQDYNTTFTDAERELLSEMQQNGTVVRAVMDPDGAPYSWYEDGEAKGIAADIFRDTAERLGLKYEIVNVDTRDEYIDVLESGYVDIWMDVDCYYEDNNSHRYKITEPYLTTTVSLLKSRSSTGKINRIAVIDNNISAKEIISSNWPEAEIILMKDTSECVRNIIYGNVDAALLMTYTAQKLRRNDVQNRLVADIVPGCSLPLRMGINSDDDVRFYGLWEKTLLEESEKSSGELVQSYIEDSSAPTPVGYLFDHPVYLILAVTAVFLILLLGIMYVQSVSSRKKQQNISEELKKALDAAEEANDAKQNFFSKMSHDIRTPLNVVLGMAQIAQKYKNDENKLDNALESINTEGNYLLALINSILDVNQLEHGHIELVNKTFIPAECVRESTEMLRPLAEKKEQTLTLHVDNEDAVVSGDAGRFSQIMINIISNAIKYTDVGGRIDVSLECLANSVCRFTCTDNGIGMTKEFIGRIFDDYSRAEDSRISHTEGTGLGMSVVNGFTELMGGRLHIDSEIGKGSTFIVEIPFREVTAEQRKAALKPHEDRAVEYLRFSGKKVLLVEDNALNAEIASELLVSIGLTVDWAENGKIGTEMFFKSRPYEYFAVFMDMQMPVMDGVEATKIIRASDKADNDIPIFAMTANTFAGDRKRCMDAGITGYISKPIDIKAIEETIKEGTDKEK